MSVSRNKTNRLNAREQTVVRSFNNVWRKQALAAGAVASRSPSLTCSSGASP